ncbi:MAG TPA: type III-B CRISPR module-associated protein Cmr5 [Caldisericia bacterium]|nr:type III-B CRISPR module-associated protein Cmr5 [Caldisericia bacterium]HPO29175.1 type III-B CRISPR module-associated protein Cmr5 [Caldisericia bacterium]
MSLKTQNQERAEFALKEVKGQDRKFATYAKKLPALITTNGLIPTLAFLKSKGESKQVYDVVDEWLNKKLLVNNNRDALEALIQADFNILRLATMEALALANWLKRMVEIEIE